MVNVTAGFLLAAYVIYMVARGDIGRLLWIMGVGGTATDADGNVLNAYGQKAMNAGADYLEKAATNWLAGQGQKDGQSNEKKSGSNETATKPAGSK